MAKASLGGKGQCLTVCSHVKKQSCHSRFFRLNYIVRERETKDFRGTKLVVMSIMNPGDSTHLGTDALDVVKGYTKITVIMFTLLACGRARPRESCRHEEAATFVGLFGQGMAFASQRSSGFLQSSQERLTVGGVGRTYIYNII